MWFMCLLQCFIMMKEKAGPHNTLSKGLCSLREKDTTFFPEIPLHMEVVLTESTRPGVGAYSWIVLSGRFSLYRTMSHKWRKNKYWNTRMNELLTPKKLPRKKGPSWLPEASGGYWIENFHMPFLIFLFPLSSSQCDILGQLTWSCPSPP